MKPKLKFIDLFAGLGGFHEALSGLGAKCVFASELDQDLSELYQKNFGIKPHGDIRKINLDDIPFHDVLCAGFPCQPFSKAGEQKGLDCPEWGDLIGYVVNILKLKKPRFFILENVPNLLKHNKGQTWQSIRRRLIESGYDIDHDFLSPHMFGIPQRRERMFIVGAQLKIGGLFGFDWPKPKTLPSVSIKSILDNYPPDAAKIRSDHLHYISVWQEFIEAFPKKIELPSFPIWAMEFGANYPLEGPSPYNSGFKGLGKYKGAFGKELKWLRSNQVELSLPKYARSKQNRFPAWKIDFLKKNRAFYAQHRKIIDPWLPQIMSFPTSFQKLEWNLKGGERNIWSHIIQFRASGIRVKKTDTAPSLVAMTQSQVPIIAWEKRYMTPRECSRLQSMEELRHLPGTPIKAYKALGNAANVQVIRKILCALTKRQNLNTKASETLAAE